jgi:hypothetical protein
MGNGSMAACFFKSLTIFSFFVFSAGIAQEFPDSIPMNEIRVLASHNSYKVEPTARTMKFINRFKSALGEENQPFQLSYSHVPISDQLSTYHIRGLELDVYNDPKGGRYFKHRLNLFIPKQRIREEKYTKLKEPGFKIIHIPDIDYQTNYLTLADALEELNAWSLSNPTHAPIFVNIELKGSALGDEAGILRLFGYKKAIPFDRISLMQMDSLLKEKLSTLFTTTEFRANEKTLQSRIKNQGWPTIGAVRGRIFVIIQGSGAQHYPSNAGAFVYGNPENPDCIFLLYDDPFQYEELTKQMRTTHMIRTRTDAGTIEARANDYSRLKKSLEIGAQILSTDYYKKDPNIGPFVIPFIGFLGN